jgi:hypothetical protein
MKVTKCTFLPLPLDFTMTSCRSGLHQRQLLEHPIFNTVIQGSECRRRRQQTIGGISSPGVQTRSRLTLVGSVAFVTFVSTLAAGLRRPFRIVCKIVRIFIFTAPDLFLGDTLPPLSFLVGAGFFSLACHAKILLRSGYT